MVVCSGFVCGFVHAFCFGANNSTEKVAVDEVATQWVPKTWPTLVSLTPLFSGIVPLHFG